MLFKLSLNNLRKSMRDYAVYFFTLIIGVAVFYVFNAIDSQTAYLEMTETQREIIDLLTEMLSGLSIFVAVVLGMLIVYASRFLMKRRKREFALYLTLGMGKGSISVMIFIETLFIGLLSLVAGVLVGIIVSQFTSHFAANLFTADMSEYHFQVSGKAIVRTVCNFGIIYAAVMLFNGIMVGKCRLIDLMQSGRKSEEIKLKNPMLCVIVFFAAAAALGYAYYRVTMTTYSLADGTMGVMILIGALSTLLLFWSVSGMLLRVIMSARRVYFKGLNSFTFRQLNSKINTMVTSMTLICLMLFVTICTLASAFFMRDSLDRNLDAYCPADCQIFLKENGSEERIAQLLGEEALSCFAEYTEFGRYFCEEATFRELFLEQFEQICEEMPFLDTLMQFPIYSISDYNSLMRLYGMEELELGAGQYLLVSNFERAIELYNEALQAQNPLNVFGNVLTPARSECVNGFLELTVQPLNDGFLVVPDDVLTGQTANLSCFTGMYQGDSKEEKLEIEKKVTERLRELGAGLLDEESGWNRMSSSTRFDIAEGETGLGGIVIFIGFYIGLIFLISSGVLLALRSLSDAVDSVTRYDMLRKLGAEEREINRSLLRQTALFFGLPLLLAAFHSIFGMKFAQNYILQIFSSDGMAGSIAGSALVILLIYGGYFLITYFSSKSIIGSHKPGYSGK